MLIVALFSEDQFPAASTMVGSDEICQQQRIQPRPPATVNSPVPEYYESLKAPVPQRKYRVNFRHLTYPYDDNILFAFYARGYAQGRIHHDFAHNACAIFADNRFDGYLSSTRDCEHGELITARWDDVLPANSADCHFYVPYSSKSVENVGFLLNYAKSANVVCDIWKNVAIATPLFVSCLIDCDEPL